MLFLIKIIERIFFMLKSYLSAWKRSFDFNGTSTRKEYWHFVVLNSILFSVFYIPFINLQNYYSSLISIGLSAPSLKIYFLYATSLSGWLLLFGTVWVALPLTIRRVRDVGMSWKWIFFISMPYIGGFFVLIFLTRPSILMIDGKQYYIKSETKRKDIILYCIASSIVILLLLLSLLVLFI